MSKKFYVTFGQSSHRKNGWIEFLANKESGARKAVESLFGNEWSRIYDEKAFADREKHFPEGCLEMIDADETNAIIAEQNEKTEEDD